MLSAAYVASIESSGNLRMWLYLRSLHMLHVPGDARLLQHVDRFQRPCAPPVRLE